MKLEIQIHNHNHSIEEVRILAAINQLKEQIMGSITELNDSIAALKAANTTGFTGVAEALTELAEDVARQNTRLAELLEQVNNPELSTQIAEITQESAATSERLTGVAQNIRDAIETPAEGPPDEEPPV